MIIFISFSMKLYCICSYEANKNFIFSMKLHCIIEFYFNNIKQYLIKKAGMKLYCFLTGEPAFFLLNGEPINDQTDLLQSL